MQLAVHELRPEDVASLVQYWSDADPAYLRGMGANPDLMPPAEVFFQNLHRQIGQPYPETAAYALIWTIDGIPSGHSHMNKIQFGVEGFMHLHLWPQGQRRQGMGTKLVRKSLPFYFQNFELQTLFCEPYALNPAPHRVLEKLGFEFVREYITIPGSINFEQPVKRWMMTRNRFEELYGSILS
ncbi:MAG: GNAT family protein [Bacteroidota bacterium]